MRIDFFQELHRSTPRDTLARVTEDKWKNCVIAKLYDREYWTDSRYGYQDYRYDGRHLPVAKRIAEHYGLSSGMRVLDVGCGMGFLLHDLQLAVPGLEAFGCDISYYAVNRAKVPNVLVADAGHALPYDDDRFDLVLSINALHNLPLSRLKTAVKEIERVSKPDGGKYLCVESYSNEAQKQNMLNWALTCESIHSCKEWEWLLTEFGYRGDFGFITF